MTNVVLKTDAVQSVRYDGMEISLGIRCEGLSMQASQRKLQESADQLLCAFQSASLDPSSFSLVAMESESSDCEQKQRTSMALHTQGAADSEMLMKIWQICTQMPFATEISVHFYLQDEDSYYQALHENALIQAQIQSGRLSQLLGGNLPSCDSLSFTDTHTQCRDIQALVQCTPVDYSEGSCPSFLNELQIPTVTLKTTANTAWTFPQ